jgi:3-mercaptopyruvate sulfurtransferase SseA
MRKILLSALIANCAALALLLAACKAPDGAETARGGSAASATPGQAQTTPGPNSVPVAPVKPPPDVVRRVTVQEAKALADRGEAVIVDVRAKEQYEGEHIKGSISVPRAELVARLGDLPKDKLLVFYCA